MVVFRASLVEPGAVWTTHWQLAMPSFVSGKGGDTHFSKRLFDIDSIEWLTMADVTKSEIGDYDCYRRL